MYIALIPFFIGYIIYTLIYDEHKVKHYISYLFLKCLFNIRDGTRLF